MARSGINLKTKPKNFNQKFVLCTYSAKFSLTLALLFGLDLSMFLPTSPSNATATPGGFSLRRESDGQENENNVVPESNYIQEQVGMIIAQKGTLVIPYFCLLCCKLTNIAVTTPQWCDIH